MMHELGGIMKLRRAKALNDGMLAAMIARYAS